MAIRSSVETITTDIASKILEDAKEVKNRNVSQQHVDWLANQMKAGKWHLNGEPIIIDGDGQLLDGQHRLWAVLEAQVTIETMVTRGVDRATFSSIDTGNGRKTSDVMTIVGEANAALLSSALGWLFRYEQGKMLWSLKPSGYSSMVGIALLKKNAGLRDIVSWASGVKTNLILSKVSASAVAFLKYKFAQHKPDKAQEFFDLISEVNVDFPGTPTRVMRDWIIKNYNREHRATTLEFMAIMVKAWKAFLNKQTPKVILWRRVGQNPEDFPAMPGDGASMGKAMKAVRLIKKAQ